MQPVPRTSITIRIGSQPAMPGRPTNSSPITRTPGTRVDHGPRLVARRHRAIEQRLAVDRELAPRGVERGHQQRRGRGAARQPDHAGDRLGSTRPVGADVQHRRLGERADDLVRRGEHGVGAELQRAGRQVGVEAEVRSPGLVDDQRHARRVADVRAALDVGCHPVVGRRDDEDAARRARLLDRELERLGRDAVRHPELVLVLGRDVRRDAAREHQAVDDAGVRVALHDDRRAERRERQRQCVVALARAVREEPGARGAVRLGGERLGPLVGGRGRPEVDPVDVGRHVDHQRRLAQRRAQAGVGARAALVPGHVEARRAAEGIAPDRIEVRGGRLRLLRDARARPSIRAMRATLLRLRARHQVGVHEAVEVAVEHAVGVADLEVGAVVLDHRVRVQDVGADLRAEVDVLRLAALARDLLLAPALLGLDQLRAQHRHRGRAVRGLRALVLALDDDAARLVRDPDRGVGLVDVLAAGAGGAVGVDLQVVVVDLELARLLDDGRDLDAGERRLAAVGRVERARAARAGARPSRPSRGRRRSRPARGTSPT